MPTRRPLSLALVPPSDPEALHAVDLPYRIVSGALDHPDSAAAWVDASGKVRAWAVFQPVFWTIDIGGDPGLLATVLDWALERAPSLGRPCWFVEAHERDTARLDTLAAAGFVSQTDAAVNPWHKLRMERTGPAPDTAALDGYRVRALDGAREVDAYVALHRHAFQSESMTSAWRNATLRHPAYRPELDLVAEAEDGSLAGFCVGWLGAGCGHLEPMGVHRDHRRRGIGAALVAELLRRLEGLVTERCRVEPECGPSPAVALYEASGFRTQGRIHLCRRDFPVA